MVKFTVLYGRPDDPGAFEDHYANAHLPMVGRMPDLLRHESAKAVAAPDGSVGGGEPPYYRAFGAYFEDMGRLQGSLSSPEGQAVTEDIPNFATGGATIFVSEIDA